MKKQKRIDYVCSKCGLKASGGRCFTVSTWSIGECDICKKIKPTTEFRDFYYGQTRIK